MKILRFMLLTLALLLPAAAVLSAPNKAALSTEEVIGTVGAYLPLVAQSPQDTWVLLKVMPDRTSGFATPGGVTVPLVRLGIGAKRLSIGLT